MILLQKPIQMVLFDRLKSAQEIKINDKKLILKQKTSLINY